ncbi:MAG: TolC family protein [Syntrophales bacterium]|nr:TolC family protein [Syntrophales bacterium]
MKEAFIVIVRRTSGAAAIYGKKKRDCHAGGVPTRNDKVSESCILLLLLILTLVMVTPSQGEMITYRNIVRDALQNSARIKVKAEDVNISNAIYRQNFAGLYPEINAVSRFEKHENLDNRNAGIDTINGEVVGGDISAWRSSAYLQGQYYFSHWYKKRYEAGYYELMRDVRGYELDIEIKKVIKELTDVFSSLAEEKIKLRYSDDILQRLQEVFRLKKEAFANGQASYEEVLKVEADIAAALKERGTIRKEYRENLERLYSYTGKIYTEDAVIEFLPLGPAKPPDDFLRLIQGTPEFKAKVKELEAIRFKNKAVSNNFLPDVSLYGRYDYYASNTNSLDSSVRDLRQTAYSAGIMISLPIFDGGVRKWDRTRNLYEIRKQDESIKAVVEEKARDIKTLQAGYNELYKSLVHYRKLAEQYGKMLTITKKAHAFGERSLLDIAEMEKDALTVERDWKVTEHALAAYEKRIMLETDYGKFISEHEAGQKATGNRQGETSEFLLK